MKKLLSITIFLLSIKSFGCDVCGCRLGGLSYGILPQHYQHFVGLRYSNAAFSAEMDHDSEYFADETSEDTYQRIDLMGRISLTPRLQLNVQLPYLINEMDGSHQKVSSNGPGDPVIMAYFNTIRTEDETSNWKNSLLVGAGVKLPFGEYQKEDQGKIINRNFQLGSGSVDYLFSTNYTLSYQDWGINAEAAYKLNSQNEQAYEFGNQLNVSAYLFRYMETSKIGFLPFGGAYFESAENHTDGKIIQINTGGSAWFATVGSQVYKDNLALNLQYQVPILQKYNSDDIATIEANQRISAGLLYNFKVTKKNKKVNG